MIRTSIPGGCTPENSNRWIDKQTGVVRRREIVGTAHNDTTYRQFAFPFGESGDAANPKTSQTLTIAIFPGTDRNNDAGRSRAKAILFDSTRGTAGNGNEIGSVPGDIVGAELEERVFETDPTSAALQDPPCGGGTDSGFCGSHAVRVVQKSWEVDTAGLPGSDRRLQSEKTIFGASTCSTCPWHQAAFTISPGNTWDGNGRHYDVETHTGSLGSDAKTITTDWAPLNWSSGPPPGQPVLPNLLQQRTTVLGTSIRDEYFEFETSAPGKLGFLRGSFVYDAAYDVALVTCRFDDGSGNVDKELTRTVSSPSAPPRTYCSSTYPAFPSSVGTDGDLFGKDYTWQHGELLTARWINGAVSTPTFNFKDVTRDATTGWVTSSRDTSGLATSHLYDALGRVHTITPPSPSELPTFVCYEGSAATTAYRAASRQACPVASSNAALSTWQHFEYDGLSRLVREKRFQPAVLRRQAVHALRRPRKRLLPIRVGLRRNVRGGGPGPRDVVRFQRRKSGRSCPSLRGARDFPDVLGPVRPATAGRRPKDVEPRHHRPQRRVGQSVQRHPGGGADLRASTRPSQICRRAACAAGGINSTTTTRKDAFGRITSVTEPSGDATSYSYDVNDKITGVTQGAEIRSFGYDAHGFLRSESTPERGPVSYTSIGGLGNVRTETQPDGLSIRRTFDFAGRLAQVEAPAGTRYLVNCWDGAATCADGSPGFAGGAHPKGRLTRRYGYNWIPTVGPVVDEQFTYGDGGGRLSQLQTAVGSGDLGGSGQATTQSWVYGNLGLVATHNHPQISGSFPVVTTYTNGLPTAVTGNGASLVTAATYNPAAGLASWTSNTSPTAVVTTITQDGTMLPRPSQISSKKGAATLFSTGVYAYDGAGNVLSESDPAGGGVFTYDTRSRILSATYGSASRTFSYDRWGNLLTNGTLSLPVDGHNHLVVGGSTSGGRIRRPGEPDEAQRRHDVLRRPRPSLPEPERIGRLGLPSQRRRRAARQVPGQHFARSPRDGSPRRRGQQGGREDGLDERAGRLPRNVLGRDRAATPIRDGSRRCTITAPPPAAAAAASARTRRTER